MEPAQLSGEPIKKSAQLSGEPTKGRVKWARRTALQARVVLDIAEHAEGLIPELIDDCQVRRRPRGGGFGVQCLAWSASTESR